MAHFSQQRRIGYRKIPATTTAPATDVIINSYSPTLTMNQDLQEGYNAVQKLMTQGPQYGDPPKPCCITEGLYLGTTSQAENESLLRRLKISHVLNCAGYLSLHDQRAQFYQQMNGIKSFNEIYAEDTVQFDICVEFLKSNRIIDGVLNQSERILVFCPDVNRSSAIVIGYMLRKGTNLLRAVHLVQSKRRGKALHNKGFVKQLVQYAKDRDLFDQDRPYMAAKTRGGTTRTCLRPRDAHLLQVY